MADFNYGNLLASVSQKMCPSGLDKFVKERLDDMTVFRGGSPKNLDAFRGFNNKMQNKALEIFNNTQNGDIAGLTSACTQSGIKISVDSVETEYVADAQETGSLSVYTFTDAKGNKVSVTDLNYKEAVTQQESEFDGMLSDLIGEIETGAVKLPPSPYEENAQMAA